MATVFYDKAAVNVGFGAYSETLLATDCSLSFSNSQSPLYVIGSKGSLGQFPSAARQGEVSFSFFTSITGSHGGYSGNIINYLASGIKNSVNSNVSGATIKFAGVSGVGYLNSYSFNVQSNSISTSNASFSFFGGGFGGTGLPVSGALAEFSEPTIDTAELATGIAHGRYTDLNNFATTISSDPTNRATVFSADYSISFNHNPIYKVGQEFPTVALYANAQESLGLTEDIFQSGLAFDQEGSDLTLSLSGLAPLTAGGGGAMQVGLKDATQVSTAMSAGMDDIVRTQKNLTSVY